MASGGTIHYKFKSQKSYDTVTFDGVYISVANLKQLIAEKKGLDKEGTAELLLTNVTEDGKVQGEGQDLTDDQSLVWKNASIIVRRVPKAMGLKTIGDAQELKEEKKRIYVKPPDAATLNMAQQAANRNRRNMLTAKREKRERMKKMREGEGEDLDNADDDLDNEEEALKEEKDIKDLIANETKQWDAERLQARNAKIVSKAAGNQPMQRQGIATRNNAAPVVSQGVQLAKEMQANKIMHQSYVRADGAGVPGPGYVCKRCNVPGHWIQDCPQGKDANVEVVRMKTAYGIPQNRLEGTDTGVLVGPTGESVEMKADETEFDRMMGFLTGKEEDEDDKMLMIGDKKDGEEENAGNEGEQHPFSPATAGVQSPTMAPPPGGPPPGGPPPLPMGPPPSTAETREERDKKRAEEKAAAKERFVNMSPEEVMNMDPAEMEKLMALIGDDENDEMMKMGDGGGRGGMPPPGMPPPHAQRYRRGPMGGFPSLGGGGYNNAVIVTEPKIDMTPEEEEEADRMLKTGDFSSIEAMLKTFGCTPEQIEHLMKTQPSFPNPFYGGGPPGERRQFAGPRPCYAYAKGECFRGDRCKYWHDPSIPAPDRSKQIGEGGPCWAFAQGRCFRGDSCRFSHDPSILPKDLENNPFRNAGVQDGPPPTQFGGNGGGEDGGGPSEFGGRKRVRENSRDRFEDTIQRDDSREGRPSSRGGYDNPPRRGNSRDRGAPPFRFGAEQQPSGPPLDHQQRGRRMPPGPPPGSKRTRDDSREPGGSRPPSRDGGRPPEAKRSRRNEDNDATQHQNGQQGGGGGFVEGFRGGRGGGRRGGGGRGRAPPPPASQGGGQRGSRSIRNRLTR